MTHTELVILIGINYAVAAALAIGVLFARRTNRLQKERQENLDLRQRLLEERERAFGGRMTGLKHR